MLFSAVNYDATKNYDDNPTSELVRYEFIELITRIAQKLYPNSTLPVALRKVIEDHLVAIYKKDEHDFSSFRAQLYTVEVQDMYSINIDNIKRVIKKYSGLGKKVAWEEHQENTLT